MGQSYGPKLVTDSLILCLDARDANSYAGEPTTNLSANSDYSGVTLDSINSSSNGGWGSTFDRWVSLIEGPAGKKVRAFHLKLTGTTSGAHAEGAPYNLSGMDSQYGTLTAGSTYTSSVWAKVIRANGSTTPHTESNLMYLVGQQNVSSPTQTVNTEWTRISCARTIAAGQTGDYRLRHYFYSAGVGDTLVIAEPQIELKGYATPYVYSSRSATNGWTDLSGNGNHGTLTNMAGTGTSHYRVGQVIEPLANSYLDFDGSNDYVATSFGSGRNPYSSPTTFVAWVKADSATASRMWLDHGSNGTNQRLYSALITADNPNIFGIQNQAWGYSSSADTSKWYHQALVMDAGTARGYYDGIAAGTKSYSSYTLPGNTRAGGRSGYIWDGQIACFAVYDKALSAAEVKKNFNAQRRRFGV